MRGVRRTLFGFPKLKCDVLEGGFPNPRRDLIPALRPMEKPVENRLRVGEPAFQHALPSDL